MKRILITLAFAGTMYAQTAKVIQLTPAETAEAKHLQAVQVDISKRMQALRGAIEARYISRSNESDGQCHTISVGTYCPRQMFEGWSGGFEYSEDFKFIVPVRSSDFVIPATTSSWVIPAIGSTTTLEYRGPVTHCCDAVARTSNGSLYRKAH